MSVNKTWPAAAMAAGLVALVALIGCGAEESVASKSAAAFEEAQKKGETFGGDGHAHGGHGTEPTAPMPPETATDEAHAGHGDGHTESQTGAPTAAGPHQHDPANVGHAQGAPPANHSTMGHGGGAHAGGQAAAAGAGHQGEGHASMNHDTGAAPDQQGGTAGHAGHGAPSPQAPAGHTGHSPSTSGTPASPVAELPTQPANILRPDALDAPAATSVLDAKRSEEMNQAMSGGHGGHGGHGAGTYRHVDAGRGPSAYEGSEPQTPEAGPRHHDRGAAEPKATVYACPMHPEVTSNEPGTCSKCGMALVERREE